MTQPDNLAREEARNWKALGAGDVENACLLTGEAVGLIHDVLPAAVIVDRMVREAQALIAC